MLRAAQGLVATGFADLSMAADVHDSERGERRVRGVAMGLAEDPATVAKITWPRQLDTGPG